MRICDDVKRYRFMGTSKDVVVWEYKKCKSGRTCEITQIWNYAGGCGDEGPSCVTAWDDVDVWGHGGLQKRINTLIIKINNSSLLYLFCITVTASY